VAGAELFSVLCSATTIVEGADHSALCQHPVELQPLDMIVWRNHPCRKSQVSEI